MACTSGDRNKGKWLDSGYIVKVELIEFPDRLDIQDVKKSENYEAFGLSSFKNGVAISDLEV